MQNKKQFKPFSMNVSTCRGYISYRNGKPVFVEVEDATNLPLYFIIKFGDFQVFKLIPEGTGSMRSKLIRVLQDMENGKKRND